MGWPSKTNPVLTRLVLFIYISLCLKHNFIFRELCSHIKPVLFQCCFTSTETIMLIRDGDPRMATSTFRQLRSSVLTRLVPFISLCFKHNFILSALCLLGSHCSLLLLGYSGVSIIHWTLTWTTGSLMSICGLFACVCLDTHGRLWFVASSEELLQSLHGFWF